MPLLRRTASASGAPLKAWPDTCPPWATAVSAWGDTFVACAKIQELLRRTGAREIGVIYYGKHGQIVDFLRHQPWVREVRWHQQRDLNELLQVSRYGDGPERDRQLAPLYGDIDPADVFLSGVRWDVQTHNQTWPYRDALLPADAWEWAHSVRDGLPPDAYFLHPWSFQSTELFHHWPHWPDLVGWLLEQTPHTYVLTGHGYDSAAFGAHPRLLNMVGQTEHMHQVLALACLCRGAITTCNSLSLWSSVRRLRAFVIGNAAIPNERNLFYRFINGGGNVDWHWHTESLSDVRASARKWL